jgi:xanthine/uracil/vitamin C permease (AzgA family)
MTSTHRPIRRTSAFDIRLVIALLIGVYGLVTTVLGLWVTTDAEIERSAGVNINLWAGIGMLVVAALFVAWTWWRPLPVPEPEEGEEPAE